LKIGQVEQQQKKKKKKEKKYEKGKIKKLKMHKKLSTPSYALNFSNPRTIFFHRIERNK